MKRYASRRKALIKATERWVSTLEDILSEAHDDYAQRLMTQAELEDLTAILEQAVKVREWVKAA